MVEKPKNEQASMETVAKRQPEILRAQIEFLKKWCQYAVESLTEDRIPKDGLTKANVPTKLSQGLKE